MHTAPEHLLLLHSVKWAEVYDDLRAGDRGARTGLIRRALVRARALADGWRPAEPSPCVAPCAA
jgi:hypothetical protein